MEVAAQERVQLLSQLAGTISHEIHNPLNAILLHVDVLEEELRDPQEGSREQLLHSLAVIKARVPQLYGLIQEFLTLVRLADMPRLPEGFAALLEDFCLEMRQPLAASNIALHLQETSHLGHVALHKPIFWRGLQTIVQYAIDTMPQGGTLTVRGKHSTDFAQLEMTLEGENFNKDQKILGENPFELVHYTGKGLGLYLVHEIVTAHGGQMTVDNATSSRGITLSMRLPLLAADGSYKRP